MGVKLSRGTSTWQMHIRICLARVQSAGSKHTSFLNISDPLIQLTVVLLTL